MQLDYGRTLMGDSLGFHIIFALLGVGIPLLVSLSELLGIVRHDILYTTMAKRWSYVMSVLFVTGAISGMIISTQLSTLWPTFMALAGKVIGLPFFLEGFAFFIEAIFLGIYLFTWKRFKNPYIHWLCSLPIVLGSVASAFFITTANAFMNSPAGFTYKHGIASNIDPIKAMFNQATPTETTHSIVSYYLTTCLFFAGMYALFLFKSKINDKKELKRKMYYKKTITFLVCVSFIFVLLIGLTGDSSAKYLAQSEPLKLAAAEGLYTTQTNAPLQVLGITTNHGVLHALTIPGLLSFLSFGSTQARVLGLNYFNPTLWPPLWIHYMFDFMVGSGIFITIIPLLFLLLARFKKAFAFSKIMLLLLFLSGVVSFCAVEFGWILTEVGRQPFAIRGIMTTKQAFTTSTSVATFGYLFPTLYIFLFAVTIWILKRHYKKNKLDL